MLQACLNGRRGRTEAPGVPLTPREIAAEAAIAARAGAEEFHIHPRDDSGRESLAPQDVAAALEAVREAVPGAPVGVSSGAWIAPGGRARHEHIRAWRSLPDYVSVNLGEEDAPEIVAILRDLGVRTEAGIWSPADARRFLAEVDPADCVRILVEMPDVDGEEAAALAGDTLEALGETGLPTLLHGREASAWACIARAAVLGLDTRVGLEDVLVLPDGSPARDNAALVAAAMGLIREKAPTGQ